MLFRNAGSNLVHVCSNIIRLCRGKRHNPQLPLALVFPVGKPGGAGSSGPFWTPAPLLPTAKPGKCNGRGARGREIDVEKQLGRVAEIMTEPTEPDIEGSHD
jgi:hypothetical protein